MSKQVVSSAASNEPVPNEPVPGVLYRLRQPREGLDVYSLAEFGTWVLVERLGGPGLHARFRLYAQFYCHNVDCNVRHVKIEGEYPYGDAPARPAFRCPGCGGPLKMLGHVNQRCLEPVPQEDGGEASRA